MIDWHDPDDADLALLNRILALIMNGPAPVMPYACPVCRFFAPSLHVFFRINAPATGRGGVWMWCSQCRIYLHASISPPAWWRNLETVPFEQLTALPVWIDARSASLDDHWNDLLDRDRTAL
jgi:hypothetical protein